jgi:hypothetical protein
MPQVFKPLFLNLHFYFGYGLFRLKIAEKPPGGTTFAD